MPSKSDAQRKMIFAKRNQYGSKEKAPKEWKWVFDKGWDTLEEALTSSQLRDVLLWRGKFKSKEKTPKHALWIWDVEIPKEFLRDSKKYKPYKKLFENESKKI